MTSGAPNFEDGAVLLAKMGPSGELGDCPFTQKANLALRFRGVPFIVHLVDLSNKPSWFLDLNEDGTTPTYVENARVFTSSDEIVEHADEIGQKGALLYMEKHPQWETAFNLVAPVFGAFVKLMKSKNESEDFAGTLHKVLGDLDGFLQSTTGPFLLGENVSALDCNFAPKLFHIMVAGKHYKGFEVSKELKGLHAYINSMAETEEWKATAAPEDVVIWGWSKLF